MTDEQAHTLRLALDASYTRQRREAAARWAQVRVWEYEAAHRIRRYSVAGGVQVVTIG